MVKTNLIARIRRLSSAMEPIPTGFPTHTAPLPGIRAVLFDIYGTLMMSAAGDINAGSLTNAGDAFSESLRSVDLAAYVPDDDGAEILREEVQRSHQARRAEGVEFSEVDILCVWGRVLDRLDVPEEIVEDVTPALAVEYECRTNPVWPMPGLTDTLVALREQGLVMGIVSNAQFYTPLMFDALLDRSLEDLGFDAAADAWSYRLQEGKPSTRLYRTAIEGLQQLGIAPEETLYVGNDMLKDIWPAGSCGLNTVLFAGDGRSLRLREDDERCRGAKPDRVIRELSELLDILG
jgi:putative hydrolase of the HAD superfamily